MKRRRVIIADSSQNLLEGIRGLLETIFDSVIMVADLDSLLDAATKIQADLAVLDISLGSKQCADAVRTIKEVSPDMKVLVMSMHDESTALEKAVSSGADGFVLKRSAAEHLIPAVEKILQGGTFYSTIQGN